MKSYLVKWQRKNKYLPLQRNTMIEANSSDEAKNELFKIIDDAKSIEILEVVEVE